MKSRDIRLIKIQVAAVSNSFSFSLAVFADNDVIAWRKYIPVSTQCALQKVDWYFRESGVLLVNRVSWVRYPVWGLKGFEKVLGGDEGIIYMPIPSIQWSRLSRSGWTSRYYDSVSPIRNCLIWCIFWYLQAIDQYHTTYSPPAPMFSTKRQRICMLSHGHDSIMQRGVTIVQQLSFMHELAGLWTYVMYLAVQETSHNAHCCGQVVCENQNAVERIFSGV